jgi:hypothetical protein
LAIGIEMQAAIRVAQRDGGDRSVDRVGHAVERGGLRGAGKVDMHYVGGAIFAQGKREALRAGHAGDGRITRGEHPLALHVQRRGDRHGDTLRPARGQAKGEVEPVGRSGAQI